MAQPLFKDFGKASKDLLTKGYPSTQKIDFTTSEEEGVNFVVTAEKKKVDDSEVVVGTFQKKYKNKHYGVDLTTTVSSETLVAAELAASDLFVDGLKAQFNFKAGKEVNPQLQFANEIASVTGSFMYKPEGDMSVDFTGVAGHNAFSFGLSTGYNIALSKKASSEGQREGLSHVHGALQWKGDSHNVVAFAKNEWNVKNEASTSSSDKTRQQLSVGGALHYKTPNGSTVAAQLCVKDPQVKNLEGLSLTFGGAYKCCEDTTLQGKIATDGKVGLSVAKQLTPVVKASLATSVDTNDLSKGHKFGFEFNLKL
eukprot:CAMPEP_0174261388 /NCGR_PEP_ID=MMETSP0439-20130205/11399_1 /TAXON_ID=0 /ORGANISM="Stereomyxa ramosa, Strain Chinc5" /LENGTH=310 /DNA_ID=CAMNT_0015345853 /DNA_START=26 /DNA_END=958 /DNA_ORIENTATION=+